MTDAIAALLDERAIINVAKRIATAIDEKDMDDLVRCFAPDALMKSELYQAQGHAELVAINQRMYETVGEVQHSVSGFQVAIDGNTATMRANVVGVHVAKGAPERILYLGAVYRDRLRRDPHGWVITERRTHIVWQKGDLGVVGNSLNVE